MRLLLVFLPAFLALGADEADYQKYLQSRERVDYLQQAVQRYEEILLKTRDPEERVRVQRALEQSMQAMDGADKALDASRKKMKPGDKIWEDETRMNGPQQADGLDPRVNQHNWVGDVGAPPKAAPAGKAPPGAPGGSPSDAFVSEDGSQKNVFYNPPAGRSVPSAAGTGDGGVRYSQPAGMANPSGRGSAEGRERHVKLRSSATGQFTPEGGPVPEEGRPLVSDREAAREVKDAEAWNGGVDFIRETDPFELANLESQALLNDIRRRVWLREADDSLAGPAERLAAMEPGSAQAHLLKALIYNRMARFADAEDSARTAVRLDPAFSAAYRTLGWAQLNQGKFAEAVETAEKALAIDPADATAYVLRAYARERLGDRKSALQDMRRAAALQPRYQTILQKGLHGQPLLSLQVAAARSRAAVAEASLPRTLQVGLVFLAGAALLFIAAGFSRWRRSQTGR